LKQQVTADYTIHFFTHGTLAIMLHPI
jgi:hypothetical protein